MALQTTTRRLALLLLVLGLVGVTIVATGGSVLSTDHDRVTTDVIVEPHDGPNGVYAHVDEDDDIVVDLTAGEDPPEGDGVNADSIAEISDVFTLTYTGDEYAHVWLEHESDDVDFYVGGDESNSIEGEANNVTLSPNRETVAVGFTVDSSDSEPVERLIESIEINAVVPDETPTDDDPTPPDDDPTPPDDDPTPPDDDPTQPDPDRMAVSGTDGSLAPPADACPAGPTVEVDAPTKTTRTVAMSDVDSCQTESIDLLGLEVGSAVTLEELAVTPAESDDVTLEATATEASKSKPVTDADATPIGAVTVDGPDDAVETVEYQFAVDRSWLEREGIDPDTVSLYGHDGDDWTALEVERTGERAAALEYAASDDGFARYVVAADLPDQEGDQKLAERSSDDAEKPPGADGDDSAVTDGDDPAATDDGDDTDASGSVAIVGLALAVTLGLLVARLARGDD